MQSEIIDIYSGSISQTYIVISSDGRITWHVEIEANSNGALCLHKTCEEITLMGLQRRNPRLLLRVKRALVRLGAREGEKEDVEREGR